VIGFDGRRMLLEGLSSVVESLLDVDLGEAALAGWKIHDRLLEAARATRSTPGVTEIVDLASHDVRSTWRPKIEVLLGSAQVARLTLELTITLRMVSVTAVVRAGKLTRIGGGRCDVLTEVVMADRMLFEHTVPLAAELFSLPIGRGIRLVAAA
jgi:hypothetical protein